MSRHWNGMMTQNDQQTALSDVEAKVGSWFVPPIVIPVFLFMLIVTYALYRT
jgi:hypothetical protein